jgi:hypothetical protein
MKTVFNLTAYALLLILIIVDQSRPAAWVALGFLWLRLSGLALVFLLCLSARNARQREPLGALARLIGHRPLWPLPLQGIIALGFYLSGDPGTCAFWLLVSLAIETSLPVLRSLCTDPFPSSEA